MMLDFYFVTIPQTSSVYLIIERLIDDFRKFRLGSRTARKDKENARQAASHALRFCLYMATGLTPKTVYMDLKFLLQMDKLRA